MEALRILDAPESLSWEYDEEADVLYIAIGEPRPAVTLDLGEGLFARYDKDAKEIVGLTILNLRGRLLASLVPAKVG
jgi:uncharacterized protein YuzE